MTFISRRSHSPRSAIAIAALVAGLAAALLVSANASTRAEVLIEFRQATMAVLARTFSGLGAMASGKIPYDAKRAAVLADRSAALAGIASETFPPESKEGATTRAKAEIWTSRAEFEKLMKDFVDRTATLSTTAKAGTIDGLKPAVGAVRQACKNCHDEFEVAD